MILKISSFILSFLFFVAHNKMSGLSRLTPAAVGTELERLRDEELQLLRKVDQFTREVKADAPMPQRRDVLDLLERAANTLAQSYHVLDMAVSLCLEGDGSAQGAAGQVSSAYRAVVNGSLLEITFRANASVTLEPDTAFLSIDERLKSHGFYPAPMYLQPHLLPLFTFDSGVVYIDSQDAAAATGGDTANPFLQSTAAASSGTSENVKPVSHIGFATAAFFAAATLLLKDRDRSVQSKALVVLPSAAKVAKLFEFHVVVPPRHVQVIAVEGADTLPKISGRSDAPPSMAALDNSLNRLVVCTADAVRKGVVVLSDVAYLFWDGVDQADILKPFTPTRLQAAVMRGPAAFATQAVPRKMKIRAHLWNAPRQVTTMAVEGFELSRDVEEFVQTLARTEKTVLVTSKTNIFIHGAQTASHWKQVPFDASTVIVAELPKDAQELVDMLARLPAPRLVLLLNPATSRDDLIASFQRAGVPLTRDLIAYTVQKANHDARVQSEQLQLQQQQQQLMLLTAAAAQQPPQGIQQLAALLGGGAGGASALLARLQASFPPQQQQQPQFQSSYSGGGQSLSASQPPHEVSSTSVYSNTNGFLMPVSSNGNPSATVAATGASLTPSQAYPFHDQQQQSALLAAIAQSLRLTGSMGGGGPPPSNNNGLSSSVARDNSPAVQAPPSAATTANYFNPLAGMTPSLSMGSTSTAASGAAPFRF